MDAKLIQKFNRWVCVAAITVMALVSSVNPVWAQDGPADANADEAQNAAREILRSAFEHYQSLERVRVQSSSSGKISMGDREQDQSLRYEISLDKNGRYAYRPLNDLSSPVTVADGRSEITFIPQFASYLTSPPKSRPGEISDVASRMLPPQVTLLNLAFELGVIDQILSGATTLTYLGKQQIREQEAHHLRIVWEASEVETVPQMMSPSAVIDAEVWIAAGESPWLLRIRLDAERYVRSMSDRFPLELRQASIQLAFDYRNWEADPSFDDDTFAYAPPPYANKAENLQRAMRRGQRQSMRGASALKGQPAPDIKLPMLDGGQFDLSEYVGEHVVVLDFFASWCPPCLYGMPLVHEVAQRYRDQGVRVVGINIQETPEQIQQFLQRIDIDMPVAMDEDGTVAGAYRIPPLPQTVIVGRDGRIREVLVGVPSRPDQARQIIARQIESVLERE